MDTPIHVEEYPLYYEPICNQIYYFQNVRDAKWTLNTEKTPLYLWKPSCIPGINGETVKKDEYKSGWIQKSKFIPENREREVQDPSIRPWQLVTATGKTFRLEADNSGSQYVVFVKNGNSFSVYPLKHRLILSLNTKEEDADECEKRMIEEKDKIYNVTKKALSVVLDRIQTKHVEIEEQFEDIDDEGDSEKGFDDEVDETKPDADDGFSDDEEIDIDDIDLINVSSDDENDYSDEENRGKKSKEDKKDMEPKTEIDNSSNNAEDIVTKIIPKTVREEDLIQFFQEVGVATIKVIKKRFADCLKTKESIEHLRTLLSKKCKTQMIDNVQHLRLKPKGQK